MILDFRLNPQTNPQKIVNLQLKRTFVSDSDESSPALVTYNEDQALFINS